MQEWFMIFFFIRWIVFAELNGFPWSWWELEWEENCGEGFRVKNVKKMSDLLLQSVFCWSFVVIFLLFSRIMSFVWHKKWLVKVRQLKQGKGFGSLNIKQILPWKPHIHIWMEKAWETCSRVIFKNWNFDPCHVFFMRNPLATFIPVYSQIVKGLRVNLLCAQRRNMGSWWEKWSQVWNGEQDYFQEED